VVNLVISDSGLLLRLEEGKKYIVGEEHKKYTTMKYQAFVDFLLFFIFGNEPGGNRKG